MRALFPGLTPGAIFFRPYGACFAVILFAVILGGCHKTATPPPLPQLSASVLLDLGFAKANELDDPTRVFTCTDPDQAAALLWSGGIGLNIGPLGTGFDSKGVPLSDFQVTDYDPSGNIRPSEPLLGFSFLVDGKPAAADLQGYSQTLDTRYGLLTTHWFERLDKGWLEVRSSEVAEGSSIRATFEFRGPAGTTLQFTNPSGTALSWSSINFGAEANAVPDDDSRRLMSESTLATYELNHPFVLTSGEATAMMYSAISGYPMGGVRRIEYSLKTAIELGKSEFWGGPPVSIDVDGPLDDQRAINSFIYYLRGVAPTPNPAKEPISPMGESSTLYGGHIFWDADIWLSPAMAFIEPDIVSDVAKYRLVHMQPAPEPPFSWESAISGKELAPPEFAKEIHVDGDVLWNFGLAQELGVSTSGDTEKILNDSRQAALQKRVADFYLSRAKPRPDGKLDLPDVKSPDESHTGSNDLYTNLIAQWTVNGGTWHPKGKVPQFALPHDSKGFLTYDGDPVRSYKQAAAVLAIYPLQYPPAEAQARQMLERFEDKVTPNGPAMSDSVHALIWARLGNADKAYDVWESSWKPFLKGPMLLFSEKRNQDRTYFTTGAAGCLQTVICGFLGFRVDEQPKPGAAWQTRLRNGRWLSIDPHLPSAWKSVTFRNFTVLGRRYTLTVRREGAKTITTVR